CLFSVFFVRAQEVEVLDEVTKQPIFNVAIYNKDRTKSTLTDFDGKADLSNFSEHEIVFFRHVSHLVFSTTRNRISRNEHQVFLVPNENQLQEVVLSVSKFRQSKADIPQKAL